MDSISNIIHSLGGEIRITHINGEGGIYCSFSAHEMQIDDILLFDFAKSISNFCKNRSICHEHGWLEDTNLFLNLISNSEDLMRIEFVYNELIVLSVQFQNQSPKSRPMNCLRWSLRFVVQCNLIIS